LHAFAAFEAPGAAVAVPAIVIARPSAATVQAARIPFLLLIVFPLIRCQMVVSTT